MICSILQLPHAIPIGVQTESGVESIGFDVKPWLDAHKDLTLSVWPTRPGEDDAYPAADVELVDNVLYWRPNGADTAIMGVGKVEILGLTGDKRKLSGWCETIVKGTSLYTTKETPDAMKVWVDEVILAGANAVAATKKMPRISDHGTWMMWDEAAGDYVDTGKPSQGEPGPKGDRGPEGDQGHAATVTVGSVTTLPAGSYATVKNSGTDIDVVLDFGIPRGADGAGGSGSGEAGEDGGFYVPEVNDGIISWSPSKADMPPVSAADIRGPQGPAGERGPEGPQGSQGVAGPQGIPGDTRVYVGSDEPPEDAEVWIDPEGAVSGSDLPAATETGRGAVILDTSLTKPGAAADAAAVGKKVTALTEEKMNLPQENGTPNHGTAGQFAVSDGKGGIVWKTLVEAEEVAY